MSSSLMAIQNAPSTSAHTLRSSPTSPTPTLLAIPRRSSSTRNERRGASSTGDASPPLSVYGARSQRSPTASLGRSTIPRKTPPSLLLNVTDSDSDESAGPTTPVSANFSLVGELPSTKTITLHNIPFSPPPEYALTLDDLHNPLPASLPSMCFSLADKFSRSSTATTLAALPVAPLALAEPHDRLTMLATGYVPRSFPSDSTINSRASTEILAPSSALSDLSLRNDHPFDVAGYSNLQHKEAAKDAVLAALSDVVTVAPPEEQYQHNASAAPRYQGSSPLNPANRLDGPAPSVPGKDGNLIDFGGATSAPAPPKKGGMGGRFVQAFKKQTADEKEAKRKAKEERMRDQINKSSVKNSRIDVIDKLDLSGIHGASMFHHDSPYDAVSAHRNKGKRAPVLAFDPSIDPMTGQPWKHGQKPSGSSSGSSSREANGSRSNLSPLAQATLARMDTAASEDSKSPGAASAASSSQVDVHTLGMYGHDVTPGAVNSTVDPDANPQAERAWRNEQDYYTQPASVPATRHDVSNPMAEVWGVAAEPWQDFATPKSRGNNGLSPNVGNGSGPRYSTDNRSGVDSSASSVLDMEAIMTGRTGNEPPVPRKSPSPNPVVDGGVSPFPEPNWGSDNGPRRNKSLIKRIKSVRQSPNVPMLDDPSEPSSRSRRATGAPSHRHSPSSPPLTRAVTDSSLSRPSMSDDRFDSFAQAGTQALDADMRRDNAAGVGAGAGGNVKRSGSLFNRFGGKNKGRSPVRA